MRKEYTKNDLQSILDRYDGLGQIASFYLFTSGFENSNYFVKTQTGKYVIKVFEGMDVLDNGILFELEVMNTCYCNGIKTPRILMNQEKRLDSRHGQKIAIVMDFIEGENAFKKDLSDVLIDEVGKESGKMDVALRVFQDGSNTRQNYEWDLKNFLILEPKVRHLPSKLDKKIIRDIFTKFKNIKTTFDRLPKGLIHNDIAAQNLLYSNKNLKAIIDFSDLAFSPYIQNIAVSMSQLVFSYNWRPQQAGIFVQSYRKHHTLSSRELDVLFDLVLARYATIVVEFNYWNTEYGFDQFRDEYVYRNYEFLKRFYALGKQAFDGIINK